jgi:hypothetical protein
MTQFRFNYALKNIPIPSPDAHLRNLIDKMESVIKRMRWKVDFFLKGDKNSNESEHFDLPSTNHRPQSRYFGNETFRKRPFQPYRKHKISKRKKQISGIFG